LAAPRNPSITLKPGITASPTLGAGWRLRVKRVEDTQILDYYGQIPYRLGCGKAPVSISQVQETAR